jgi:hypothetical protein
MPTPASQPQPAVSASRPAQATTTSAPKINRDEIAAIVDRFLANRQPEEPLPAPSRTEAPRVESNGGASSRVQASQPSTNGRQTADFVSEDDVKRAIQKGEKIYVSPKTIITPSARDIGDPAEVFAKA